MMKILLLSLFIVSSSFSAIYKGQLEYIQHCVNCHDRGHGFIATKTQDQWTNLMNDNGLPLAMIHLLKKEAKESHSYYESKVYEKKSKHLKQFLVEYAKDSGKIPACN